MTKFTLYTQESAPESSKDLLKRSLKEFGMIPNLHAIMAEAPALLESYQEAHRLFQTTSFNADELTVVWQTINVEHECHYCVPAHAMIASSMEVDASITACIKAGEVLVDPKLEALRTVALILVRERGRITDEQKNTFYSAGYTKQQLLEVVLGISQKVMSNFINHIADTPIDAPFAKFS